MTNTYAKSQPSSLSGSCFMAGGWKTPPPRVSSRAKSPGLIGLSLKCIVTSKSMKKVERPLRVSKTM